MFIQTVVSAGVNYCWLFRSRMGVEEGISLSSGDESELDRSQVFIYQLISGGWVGGLIDRLIDWLVYGLSVHWITVL